MRLTYRGINYEAETPSIDVTEGEMAGKFQGQPWHYHYPRHLPQIQPNLSVRYRGLHYHQSRVTPSRQSRQLPIDIVNGQSEQPAPPYTSSQESIAEQKAHIENIHRNLERRLSVAKQQGNEQLISILEQEFQQLSMKE